MLFWWLRLLLDWWGWEIVIFEKWDLLILDELIDLNGLYLLLVWLFVVFWYSSIFWPLWFQNISNARRLSLTRIAFTRVDRFWQIVGILNVHMKILLQRWHSSDVNTLVWFVEVFRLDWRSICYYIFALNCGKVVKGSVCSWLEEDLRLDDLAIFKTIH